MSSERTDHRSDDPPPEPTAGRRDWLTKGGAAAAIAAVAGLGAAHTARAANGDPMQVGTNHTGTATTNMTGGTTFRVQNGGSVGNASVYGTQNDGARYGVRGDNSGTGGAAVFGAASGTSGRDVLGQASGSGGRGVFGRTLSTDGVGVYGLHDTTTASGTGVIGRSRLGTGVTAMGTNIDVSAAGTGRMRLTTAGQTGSATQTGAVGTIARDSDGSLWYCFATNQWQQIAGPGTGGGNGGGGPVTGTFTPITPARVFDSRIAAIPNSGIFTPNSNRLISVHDGRDVNTGAVNAANVVPPSASAIAFNVTVAQTTGNNFLTVAPGNAAGITASTINWSGVNLANGSIVGIDNQRRVRVFTGPNAGANAHCILDVTGYFT